MNLKRVFKKNLIGFGLICTLSCGDNLLTGIEQDHDPATAATIALDERNPDKAIAICLKELGSAYKNIVTNHTTAALTQNALRTELDKLVAAKKIKNPRNIASILSSAYALKSGVDLIDVALKLAGNEASNDNIVVALANSITSNPTQSVLDNIELALVVLRGIGSDNYRAAETYKDAIFQMAQLSLFTASLGDLNNISVDQALQILDFLSEALLSAASTNESEGSDAEASIEMISTISTSIGIETSDTDEQKRDKLESFFNGI